MTMHDDAFDELASAYLDNEVGPAERATVEADAALLDRVDEFGRLRASLMSSILGMDEGLLGAALAAFDEASFDEPVTTVTSESPAPTVPPLAPTGTPPPAPTITPVRSLDQARRRRANAVYGWLGAAAAVGVLAVGINAVRGGTDSSDGSEAAGAPAFEPASSDAAAAFEAAVESAAPAAAEPTSGELAVATESPAASEAPAAETNAAAPDLTAAPGEATADAPTDTVVSTFDAPILPVISTEEELIEVGQSTIDSVASSTEPAGDQARTKGLLISCPELGAEALQEIVWKGKQAFILLKPSIAEPTEILAVSNNCEVLTTAPFAG